MYRKALLASGIVIVGLLVAVGVVYAFGTPQAPDPAVYTATPGPAETEPSDATGGPPQDGGPPAGATVTEVPADGVPAPDESVPLAIQIPGCKCHSDDPKLVEEHSKYRMNQCAGCHGGQTPTGQ